MYCPYCGYKNQEGAVRCGRCGKPLASSRQSQNRNQSPETPPHAPRSQQTNIGHGIQGRRFSDGRKSEPRSSGGRNPDPRSSGNSRYEDRRYEEPRRSFGTGKLILLILLILILLSGIGFAVWYFVIRPNTASAPAPKPQVTVEGVSPQTGSAADGQSSPASQPQAAVVTPLPESQQASPSVQEPAAAQEAAGDVVHEFAQPVLIYENGPYSMTSSGYIVYGSSGYGLQVSFTNNSASDVYFGYNQPVLDDSPTNIQKSFRCPAGSTRTEVFRLGNVPGGSSTASKVTLPLVVYAAEGNEYALPSDMIESGNHLGASSPVIMLS